MDNVFIFVADSLRLDYLPQSIRGKGVVLPTLTPAGYSPISFASLVTGLDPRKHNVRSFYDTLGGNMTTCFDKFPHHCFYDHPEDALCTNVFRDYITSKELAEMEEPFFYIERALDTHAPYGEIGHGNEIPPNPDTDGDTRTRYETGVRQVEEHFWRHVEELKELDLYDDTLIVFTADHGELLGEQKLLQKRFTHNAPVCPEIYVVPTVFLNHAIDRSHMRLTDLIPTALSITGRTPIGSGRDLTQDPAPDKGYTMLQINTTPLLVTGCQWEWDDTWKRSGGGKTDLGTLLIDLIKPFRSKVRDSGIGDFLRQNNVEQRNFSGEDVELEGVDI